MRLLSDYKLANYFTFVEETRNVPGKPGQSLIIIFSHLQTGKVGQLQHQKPWVLMLQLCFQILDVYSVTVQNASI